MPNMNKGEFEGVVLKKMKEKGLVMSRVPTHTREEFIKLAQDHFADDRGMLLHHVWNVYKQAINIQETFDVKLNYIIQLLETIKINSPDKEEKPKTSEVRMLSGRRVKGGTKKNE